jgi:hypothetical protein
MYLTSNKRLNGLPVTKGSKVWIHNRGVSRYTIIHDLLGSYNYPIRVISGATTYNFNEKGECQENAHLTISKTVIIKDKTQPTEKLLGVDVKIGDKVQVHFKKPFNTTILDFNGTFFHKIRVKVDNEICTFNEKGLCKQYTNVHIAPIIGTNDNITDTESTPEVTEIEFEGKPLKVGDKLWWDSKQGGWGVVTTLTSDNYAIEVEFDKHKSTFTKDGKYTFNGATVLFRENKNDILVEGEIPLTSYIL